MSLKEAYERDGFVKVLGLISNDQFPKLVAACERAMLRTRSGSWPHRRTLGKQFPPYGNENSDSWGVQLIMHPDLGEPEFAEWYCSDGLVTVVKELLECEEDDLQMELFNLLINPLHNSFALRWHRDDIKETATEEEERVQLSLWHSGVQWNTALYTDSCLYLVPKSHLEPRSVEQRKHFSTMDPPKDPMDMPGAMQVTLRPGETVFYNSNILHCATYDPSATRVTLHATMGSAKGGTVRARNILQHGLRWMEEDRFRDGLRDRGKAMLGRLIEMKNAAPKEVGFSLA